MAIDKKLQIFDDEGNPVDYDILASDVKFLPDGKDLPTKLAELEQEIGEGGYTPPAGGIPKTDLASSVQQTLDDVANKVDKVNGKGLSTNDFTTALLEKLNALPNAAKYEEDIADAGKVKTVSVNNGTPATPDQNGNVNIQVQAGDQVSVIQPDPADGTFIIRVGSTDYTINLNHTHEGMAKLVKCTEATLPQTLADDTIYVQVDNLTTPTEIEALRIFGLEFTGGGLPAGTPQITSPKSTIPFNLGTAYGQGGATGTVQVKGKNLTANSSLTVSVGSGFSLSYGQQSGSSITISAADATIGADVDVFATAYGTSGTLLITSQTDNINHSVELTSNVSEDLLAVKLTGTQWLQTDYCPKPNTRFEFDCKFIKNTYSSTGIGNDRGVFLGCANNTNTTKVFYFNTGVYSKEGNINRVYSIYAWVESPYTEGGSIYSHIFNNEQTFCQRSVLNYSNGSVSFLGSTWTCESRTSTSSNPLCIGYSPNNDVIYGNFDLEIYGLKLYDGSTLVRDFKPVAKNGIAGLLDEVSGTFISSETITELVAIPLT